MWKHLISGYLNFSKKDRRAILVLLVMILFFIMLPYFYPYFITESAYDHKDFEKAIAALQAKQPDSSRRSEKRYADKPRHRNFYNTPAGIDSSEAPKGELFYFDPNSARPSDWKRLGVHDKTISTIQNYLSKGGKFYRKEDIGKIWGLTKTEAERLSPYVRFNVPDAATRPVETAYVKKEFKKLNYTPAVIDVNIADTTAFIALPGIGSKLSLRIVNFREKLGGFYNVAQIGETFGLPDSTFQKIKPWLKIRSTELRLVNINTATADEMRSHPYIRYALANALFQYRAQHGDFTAVADIKKILAVTEEVFNKLAPYLTVN